MVLVCVTSMHSTMAFHNAPSINAGVHQAGGRLREFDSCGACLRHINAFHNAPSMHAGVHQAGGWLRKFDSCGACLRHVNAFHNAPSVHAGVRLTQRTFHTKCCFCVSCKNCGTLSIVCSCRSTGAACCFCASCKNCVHALHRLFVQEHRSCLLLLSELYELRAPFPSSVRAGAQVFSAASLRVERTASTPSPSSVRAGVQVLLAASVGVVRTACTLSIVCSCRSTSAACCLCGSSTNCVHALHRLFVQEYKCCLLPLWELNEQRALSPSSVRAGVHQAGVDREVQCKGRQCCS